VSLALTAPAAAASLQPSTPGGVSVVESVPSANVWLTPQPSLTMNTGTAPSTLPVIAINEGAPEQVVQGFGAAMTDSSAWLIENQLSAAARQTLLTQLFGSSGIGLSFLRIPIGSSDYTATGVPYSYDDLPPGQTDPLLTHFSIRHDLAYILPALRQALAINPHLQLLASPWSAPAWMKRNDSLSNVQNKGKLLAKAYLPWAEYIVKFLQEYAAAGVDVGAVTPQNEPGNPTPYPGMNMSAASLANWTTSDLIPALRAAHLTTQVYGSDLGWGSATETDELATGETQALAGVAWHCYFGSPDVMESLHVALPTVPEIVDECSPGITPIPTSEVVIGSLRNWASTVALWNLALNRAGGPVEVPNRGCPGCYGLATIVAGGQVWLSSAYFELGQASIAIEPGARIVSSNTFVQYDYLKPGVNFISPNLDDVAAVNPDGSRALVTYNNGLTPVTFAVQWNGQWFSDTLPAGATATFRWNVGAAGNAERHAPGALAIRAGSAQARAGSAQARAGSAQARAGSAQARAGSAQARAGSAQARAGSGQARAGGA
jgi:glucosylceramidase